MLEALWSIEFQSNAAANNAGGGVLVLETERVLGGDPWFTIIGEYVAPQGTSTVEATVNVKRYRPGSHSIFGPTINELQLKLSGVPSREGFTMKGHVVGKPSQIVAVKLVRRAELPG